MEFRDFTNQRGRGRYRERRRPARGVLIKLFENTGQVGFRNPYPWSLISITSESSSACETVTVVPFGLYLMALRRVLRRARNQVEIREHGRRSAGIAVPAQSGAGYYRPQQNQDAVRMLSANRRRRIWVAPLEPRDIQILRDHARQALHFVVDRGFISPPPPAPRRTPPAVPSSLESP